MTIKGENQVRQKILSVFIHSNERLSTALRQLNESSKQILFVVDDNRLKGTLSDGDIRRFLLANGTLDAMVSDAANFKPRFLTTTERGKARTMLEEWHVPAIPIIDEEMKIEDIVFRYESVDVDQAKIRVLEKNDVQLVLEFFDQMAGDTRAMFNRGDVNRIRALKHLCSPENDAQIHFAAVVNNPDGTEIIVGYVFLWDIDKKIPWLGIAVREDWKGHHLGRRLLSHIDEWAEPQGYGGLMLTSVPANIRAHSLYVRMGFEYMGSHPNGEFLYIKRFDKK